MADEAPNDAASILDTGDYIKSSELFESAIHILCGNGSSMSRLKRAYIVISEVNPAFDLPESLITEFYELQYCLNSNYSRNHQDVLTDSIRSLNAMELSLVTSSFIKIYSELRSYDNPI